MTDSTPTATMSLPVGKLAPRARLMSSVGRLLTVAGVSPTPEKLVLRPLSKRQMKLPRAVTGPLPAGVVTSEVSVPAEGRDVRVKIYRPAGVNKALPWILYLHGGGWVMCSVETTDNICMELATRAGVAVASVDYRLSPETKYPGPLDDGAEALTWLIDNAADLGLAPDHFGFAGDSAGGNLAAALTVRSLAGKLPMPKFQGLIYPAIDGTLSTASMRSYDGPGLNGDEMRFFFNCYADDLDRTDPELSPFCLQSLADSPPTVVITAGFDPLRDEGGIFAERLRAAGVDVTHQHYPNVMHGFVSMPALAPDAYAAMQVVADLASRALRPQLELGA